MADKWFMCAVFLCSMRSVCLSLVDPDTVALNDRPSLDDYHAIRNKFIDSEENFGFGSDIQLNAKEQKANEIIMAAKQAEYAESIAAPSKFLPSRHIFETFAAIQQSKLFQIVQAMPKGGILHAHDTALCSADYIVSLTYWPHLWQFSHANGTGVLEFLFSFDRPTSSYYKVDELLYGWRRVSDVRAEMGPERYDKYARSLFTLYDDSVEYSKAQFGDANEVWRKFEDLFDHDINLLRYAPIWKDSYKQAFKEVYADGVQYLEVRSSLPQVSVDACFCFDA